MLNYGISWNQGCKIHGICFPKRQEMFIFECLEEIHPDSLDNQLKIVGIMKKLWE